jgi:hypothetical protein
MRQKAKPVRAFRGEERTGDRGSATAGDRLAMTASISAINSSDLAMASSVTVPNNRVLECKVLGRPSRAFLLAAHVLANLCFAY